MRNERFITFITQETALDMALADICGISDSSYMKAASFTPDDFAGDMFRATQNFENNYQLAVPPFANVRLCR